MVIATQGAPTDESTAFDWRPYVERYQRGEWRATVFRDLVLDDARRRGGPLVFADIGCGKGFDDNRGMQRALATQAKTYLGIEPDPAIELQDCFARTWRCLFEEADVEPGSVHVAFAVMVLEHLADPQRFWDKVQEILAPGGVFWGFTVDRRHWFCRASLWSERLGLKEFYLRWLRGRRGVDRYENYPVYYRSNSPEQLTRLTSRFRRVGATSFGQVGQLAYYLPRALRSPFARLDRSALARGRPGMLLVVRAEK